MSHNRQDSPQALEGNGTRARDLINLDRFDGIPSFAVDDAYYAHGVIVCHQSKAWVSDDIGFAAAALGQHELAGGGARIEAADDRGLAAEGFAGGELAHGAAGAENARGGCQKTRCSGHKR